MQSQTPADSRPDFFLGYAQVLRETPLGGPADPQTPWAHLGGCRSPLSSKCRPSLSESYSVQRHPKMRFCRFPAIAFVGHSLVTWKIIFWDLV